MLDVLHAVELVLNLPRNLNQLPSCLNQLPNCLNQLPSHLNRLPSRLDLPGTVPIAVSHLLLQRRHILDALHAVVFVPNLFMLFPLCQSVPFLLFLPHRVSPNVILAAFRCRLATISPAVWNAEIAEGTCPPLASWTRGANGVPSNLATVAEC